MRRRRELSQRERADIWRRYGSGESLRSISRGTGRNMGAPRRLIASTGGRQPREMRRSELRLSLAEREEISRGLVAGLMPRHREATAACSIDGLARGGAQQRTWRLPGLRR
jgi:hypothetical protein